MVKNFIKTKLSEMGIFVKKLPKILNSRGERFDCSLTMRGGLSRSRDRGAKFKTIIDVGASDGRWSIDCLEFFPNAKYLLVEAQSEHETLLSEVKVKYPNFDFVIAAAGVERGSVFFRADSLFGGAASSEPIKDGIEVQMTTIDYEVKQRNLKPPFLIKLDTHGFEIPILKGASETLKQAELVIIETYNYRLTIDSLKYFEMCVYMEKLGFSSIEMVDLMLRQHDASFWQMDIFFMPSTNPAFNHNAYL